MWEVAVLDAIIQGTVIPESGPWRTEAVVETLHRIRADADLTAALEGASAEEAIARFLELYERVAAESD